MSVRVTFTCDACGATGDGIAGGYTHPDPPQGWVWFWGSPLAVTGPHACSETCWRKVSTSPDGKFYLPDSQERDADRKNASMARTQPEMWQAPAPAKTPRNPSGWCVYFIQRGEDGPVKIGSSRDAHGRLRQLQTACAEQLRLLATIAGGGRPALKERDMHDRFAAHRMQGEWFRPAPELMEYIREHGRAA